MESNNILSIISLVVSLGSAVLSIINHKRIRSTCGEKELSASIDIESTIEPKTPKPISIRIPK